MNPVCTDDPANKVLTEWAPSGPDGLADGPSDPPALPEVPEAVQTLPEAAPATVPAEAPAKAVPAAQTVPEAARLGIPDALPPTWCNVCRAEVKPYGKGKCPRCHTFLKFNFVARRHPVNKLRVQQLLDNLTAEYRPDSQRLRSMCEQYAAILEQLETMKPGSPDHQRLVLLSQQLGADLEASMASRVEKQHAYLENLTVDQLIERTTKMLDQLLAMRDNEERRRKGQARIEAGGSSPFDTSPIVDRSVVENIPASSTARPPVQDAAFTAVQARTEPEPACPTAISRTRERRPA